MRSDVLERLRQAFTTPGALEALAERLGTDRRGVQRALTFGVPVTLGGLHDAVSRDPSPWAAATTALVEPESLGEVVAGGPTPTGQTLAEQAFGDRLAAVTDALAGTAGIPPTVAGGTLATLVPLSLLAARDGSDELDRDDLVRRLEAAAQESAASVPGGEEAVTGVLAATPPPVGETAGDLPSAGPAATPASSRNAWPLWIGVAVLALALVFVGAWLATRNGGDGDGSNTTVSSVASSAAAGSTATATTAAPQSSTAASSTQATTTTPAETTAASTTVPVAVQQMNDIAKGTLVFEPNSTTLGADAGPALDQIAGILNNDPSLNVFVDGHTDNLGDANENLQLSELRANVVVAELTSRGVNRDRLTPRGFGGERPIADNSTPEGQAENRRIEFTYRP